MCRVEKTSVRKKEERALHIILAYLLVLKRIIASNQSVFKYIYLQLETKFNLQRPIFNKHGGPNLVIDNLLQKI